MSFSLTRRHFIQGASAVLALNTLTKPAFAHLLDTKAYRVGLIGSGWYGKSDLFRLMQVAPVEVVAICDVDKNMLTEAAALISKRQKSGGAALHNVPKQYGDYKQMLADNKFDIILIGTPDHWHALQAIDAIKAGAHVYLQKPISVDVIEGEAVLAAARKYNRVVQIGTQRRSTPHLMEAKKNIVDKGLLGKVSHVDLCCYYHMRANKNPAIEAVPSFFDYDKWTGPAPLRPYDGLPHRGWWRAFNEYGNGIVGDMCVHMFDAARWMLDLGWPKRISSTGGIYVQKDSKANISDTQTALFEYDDLNCEWNHRSWGTAPNPDYPWAFTLYGDKGTLMGSPWTYDFIPVGKGEKIHREAVYEREKYPEDTTERDIEIHAAPATRQHMLNFLEAIEKGGRPVADVEQGHISTASCVLANMSMQLGGRPLVYDPKKHVVVGDAEATKLLQRTYRKGYQHPDPARV